IDEVLDNLHKVIVNKAEEKQIDLVFSVAKQVPQNLIGDPLRLGQVLLNLCTNAIKFTNRGTVVVAIETMKTQSNLITLKFSITDTGIGLDEEQQQKLFQSFSQVDSSTTRKYGGTGLGLAISKQLTELMQGKIWVDSQPGVGSTFSFTAVFGLGVQGSEYHTLPVELKHMPVLVIDDNLIALEIFTDMLESFSFDVYSASSAEKGLEIVDEMNNKNNPLKLILMDWRLPGINGIEAARLIKERKDLKIMPSIILITAYTNDDIISSARAYLDAYLPKPLTHSYLYDSIVTLFADTGADTEQKRIPVIATLETKNSDVLYYPKINLLLVEDNITNQEVAKAILEETKMNIDIANNGYEAVEKIRENNYDLVLMDIQMPKMDGLEATTIIRQDSKYDNLPIIAMTAHALQKDKDECKKVGMNDYIAKPFVVDEFFVTLKKWLPEPELQRDSVENNSKNSELPLQQVFLDMDNTEINLEEALSRFKGNTVVLMRILYNFISNKEMLITQVSEFINDNDWENADRVIHGLKGSSGNICANKIYALSVKLELSFKQKDKQQSKNLLQQIGLAYETAKKSVNKLQVAIESDPNSHIKEKSQQQNKTTVDIMDKTLILQLIKQLEVLIVENNLGAKNTVKQLNTVLTHSDLAQELKQLNKYLADFEFDQALLSVRRISQDFEKVSA
ncbi:MAG: response regulator, partial [Pseudomonadota bacterium]